MTSDLRRFGLTKEEAAATLSRIAAVPLDPKLEERLAMAVRATRRGWWWTPGGLLARYQFHKWRAGQRCSG